MARKREDIELLVEAAKEISQRLTEKGIPHVVLGGVAVHLHGAERKDSDDVDFLVRESDQESVIVLINEIGFKECGKYYIRDQIKIQITSITHDSYPNLESEDECRDIDGVRVPTIDKLILTKAEICREILDKILSKGIGGPRRRSSLMKHFTDLAGLIQVYPKKK